MDYIKYLEGFISHIEYLEKRQKYSMKTAIKKICKYKLNRAEARDLIILLAHQKKLRIDKILDKYYVIRIR